MQVALDGAYPCQAAQPLPWGPRSDHPQQGGSPLRTGDPPYKWEGARPLHPTLVPRHSKPPSSLALPHPVLEGARVPCVCRGQISPVPRVVELWTMFSDPSVVTTALALAAVSSINASGTLLPGGRQAP